MAIAGGPPAAGGGLVRIDEDKQLVKVPVNRENMKLVRRAGNEMNPPHEELILSLILDDKPVDLKIKSAVMAWALEVVLRSAEQRGGVLSGTLEKIEGEFLRFPPYSSANAACVPYVLPRYYQFTLDVDGRDWEFTSNYKPEWELMFDYRLEFPYRTREWCYTYASNKGGFVYR